jgi:hypothetical protein
MSEHTPTPWEWRDVAGAGIEICAPIGGQIKGFMQPGYEKHPVKIYQLCGFANVQIACERWVQFEPEGWAEMQKANAALIVRAVNSHASNEAKIDALTKALEEARDGLLAHCAGSVPETLQRIDAALSSHTEQEGGGRG